VPQLPLRDALAATVTAKNKTFDSEPALVMLNSCRCGVSEIRKQNRDTLTILKQNVREIVLDRAVKWQVRIGRIEQIFYTMRGGIGFAAR
jgi:hypothetical protein